MLIDVSRSWLLVVDVQEKLVPAVFQHERFVGDCSWLIALAQTLAVPVVFSEQYPQGLGHTLPALRELAPAARVVDKVHFSCTAAACLPPELLAERDQIVVTGMEAHVCVLQTVLGLLEQGRQVFVVADVITSRNPRDIELAIERMRAAGATVVSREMVLFEWLRQAGSPLFKTISKRFLQRQA
ncbi:hydrolase [Chitinivorax sp. PXF-14]|uniref:hydrolase n=1 Tax=Chitinivorax sp. PXF-14 TaxID=3230488 RepID=UPI0034673E8F